MTDTRLSIRPQKRLRILPQTAVLCLQRRVGSVSEAATLPVSGLGGVTWSFNGKHAAPGNSSRNKC
jgi:hypothetical protein